MNKSTLPQQSTPATQEQAPAPKGGSTSNQSVGSNLGLNTEQCLDPSQLPEAGTSGNECVPSLIVARGDTLTQKDITLQHARVSTIAVLWNEDVGVGQFRLAQQGGGTVIELLWPSDWGGGPQSQDAGELLQPVDARLAVNTARTSKGWGKVQNQTAVESLLAGETNQLSAAAQRTLRGEVSSNSFSGKGDQDQATYLDGLITNNQARPGVVAEPVTAAAQKVTRAGPTVEKDHDFRGKKADANVYTLTFSDGQVIKVYMPVTMDPGLASHNIDQIEEAVSKLPEASRKVAKDVTMNAVENPDDAYWARQYNDPNFHSYMTAGAEGRVTIYPDDTNQMPSQDYMNGTMIHETGHSWSYQQWGNDKTKGGWAKWQTAMGKDKISVSNYAINDIAEDVAETIQVYGSTKGKPAYAEYKAMVPNRFAILEAELK